MKMFVDVFIDRHRHYTAEPAVWQSWEAHRLLCVLTPPIFPYCSIAFGKNAPQTLLLLLEIAITEFTIISIFCFARAAEHDLADLFFSARLRALNHAGCLRAIEGVLVLLPSKMWANILERGHFCIFINSAVDSVAAFSAFARAGEADWAVVDCWGWASYVFVEPTIVSESEWHSGMLQIASRGVKTTHFKNF